MEFYIVTSKHSQELPQGDIQRLQWDLLRDAQPVAASPALLCKSPQAFTVCCISQYKLEFYNRTCQKCCRYK